MATEANLFIMVEVRSVYGNETVYPACNKAACFCRIAGSRTLTANMLTHIKTLGYEIRLAPQITKILEVV